MEKYDLPAGTIVPDHIAIILDGNGRWARSRDLPATRGHEVSARRLAGLMRACRKFGVHTLTIWGFSTENWKRPPAEVKKILTLIKFVLAKYEAEAMSEGIRLVHLGRKDRLPKDLVSYIKKVEEETKNNNKNILNIAIDYGGRDEIIRAVQKIIKDKIPASKIDEKLVDSYMDTSSQPYPNPDLFIRPSGEQRTSGLMPWQTVYCEFYWEEDHLPDISTNHIRRAILDYSRRRRRFGGKGREKHMKFNPEVVANLEVNWWRLGKVPGGVKFRDFATSYIKEQYGMSKDLAKRAGKYFLLAVENKDKNEWEKAVAPLKEFYRLIKRQVKLAFEPEVVSSLRIKLWREMDGDLERAEETANDLTAEEFRISKLQATKASHLRLLAEKEKSLALANGGEIHWEKAKDYLHKYYKALKERVA